MCPRLSRNAEDDAIGLPLLTSAGDYTLDEMISHMMGGGGHVAGHVARHGNFSVASRKRKQVSTPLQPLGLQDLVDASCLWEQEEDERTDDVTLDEFMAQFQDQGREREGGGSEESEEAAAKRAKCTPLPAATTPAVHLPTMHLPTMQLPTMLKGVNSAPTPIHQLSMPPIGGAAAPLACPGTSSFCSAHSVTASASLPSSGASHHGPVLGSGHHFKGCFPPATPPAAPLLREAAPHASSNASLTAELGCRASTSPKGSSPVGSLCGTEGTHIKETLCGTDGAHRVCGTQTKRSWGRTLQEEGRVTAAGVPYKEANRACWLSVAQCNRPVRVMEKQALVEGPGYQASHPFGPLKLGGFPCGLRSDTWSLALLQQRALLANESLQQQRALVGNESLARAGQVSSQVGCKDSMQRSMLPETPGVSKQRRAWGGSLKSPNSRLETSGQLSREGQRPWTAAEALIALTAGRGSKRAPGCRYGSDVFGMF